MNVRYFQVMVDMAQALHKYAERVDDANERTMVEQYRDAFLYVVNLQTYNRHTQKTVLWYMPENQDASYLFVPTLPRPSQALMQDACDFYQHAPYFQQKRNIMRSIGDTDIINKLLAKQEKACKHYRFHWSQTAQIERLPSCLSANDCYEHQPH